MSQILWPAHTDTTYTYFHRNSTLLLTPKFIFNDTFIFWNHIILFKIHLLLRTSWFSVCFSLHWNITSWNLQKYQQNKTWDLLLQISLYVCFLSKEYYQKKLPRSDPMLLSTSLNRNERIHLGRVGYFYYLCDHPTSFVFWNHLSHWIKKYFPYRKIGNLT